MAEWKRTLQLAYSLRLKMEIDAARLPDVVHARADRIWQLITTPTALARWSDTKVIEAPDRELRARDRLVLGAGLGRRLKVMFDVQDAVRPRRLALSIRLPLGVTNNEVIEIAPIGGDVCRVTFN